MFLDRLRLSILSKRKSSRIPIRKSSHLSFYQPRLELLEDRLVPSIFTVNTTSDDLDGGTLADPAGPDGTLSLREAITVANLNPGQSIEITIPGTGVQTIHVGGTPGPTFGTPLPIISSPMSILANQPGTTNSPLIELDGTNAGTAANGLEISATGVFVGLLAINRFQGNGIQLEGGGHEFISDCFVGTDASGTSILGNGGNGIFINNAGGNSVTGVSSGNGQNGVLIQGAAATGNRLTGLFVGTDVSGKAALPNNLDGVLIDNAPNNLLDTSTISGNSGAGIHIRGLGSSANLLDNDTIGGGPGLGNLGNGVLIENAPNNDVGGPQGEVNTIIGNGQNGVLIQGAGAIGNQVAVSNVVSNNMDGVRIDNASQNTVINDSFNVQYISGNKGDGVHILGAGATGNLVEGYFLGLDSTGMVALPNGGNGVFIDNARGNTIGRASALSRGTAICGNTGNGILIQGPGATNNLVQGCSIGLSTSPQGGPAAVPNYLDGIRIDGAVGNMIGSATGPQNFISGNDQNGIDILGTGATNNVVQGTIVGLSTPSPVLLVVPNGLDGIRINGVNGNQIGSANGAQNIVSGNAGDGIHIMGTDATGNVVQNNLIGLTYGESAAAGNKLHGIALEGTGIQNNLIGGTTAGAGNTIAFNGAAGVAVFGDPMAAVQNTGNAILGNSIHDNALGIDLVSTTTYPTDDGVTMNTSGGPHSGPNQLQNFPVLNSAELRDFGTRVTGS
jgi:hypothetical protein